jgi:hypothetical protein
MTKHSRMIPNSPLKLKHATWKISESLYSRTFGFAIKSLRRILRVPSPRDPGEIS